jgi:hypothetical protein
MAKELVLMERGFDSMNVPGEKVTDYLAAGWKEISRKPMNGDAKPSLKPAARELPAPSASPTPAAPSGKRK